MWHLLSFKYKEIIDVAVEIEKMGSKFYRKLAEKAPNEQVKSLLLYLADEEEVHIARFTELGKDAAPENAPESYPGEYMDYMGSIVENHLFNDADKIELLVEDVRSGLDIIKLATDFEKDTILFLSGFRNLILKEKQSVIDDLIMEEQIHLIKLARLRKEVKLQEGK